MGSVFASVDMWRRSTVPTVALIQLAVADAFLPSLKLERRDALWAIKALCDEPLPLFAAAAEHEMAAIAEQQEPDVALRQMTGGHNVIEDYSHTGLKLRQHPVAFPRKDLSERNIITCAEAMNGRWVYTAGLVLVRQKGRIGQGRYVHLVAQQLFDLTADLVGLADRDSEFKLPTGPSDEFAHGGGGQYSRDEPKPIVPRDLFTPDLHINMLKGKSRNFH